ncbi:MAG TPA: photosynthetic reaction center cytochrome c subunit family protein, partial [Bryobacteraceae bacterium]
MRILLCLFLCSISLLAQRGRGGGEPVIPPGPPKNLKILPANVNIQQTMGAFRTALGVQCTYCHVQGDFASDDNAKKGIARNMLRIAADINANFPDGKMHVTCY